MGGLGLGFRGYGITTMSFTTRVFNVNTKVMCHNRI